MRKLCLIIVMNLLCFFVEGKTVLLINDQQSFDLLPQKMIELVSSGENKIVISLSEGKYVFKEKHICLMDVENPKLSILIRGNNAILIPEGINYSDGDDFKGSLSIYHGWLSGKKDVAIWSTLEQSDRLVEITDLDNKICRVKSTKQLNDSREGMRYIQVTQWYKSNVYNIREISDNYIYFVMPDLSFSDYKREEFNINDDYNYFGKKPRFRLCNVYSEEGVLSVKNGKIRLPSGVPEVRDCKSSMFLYMRGCNIRKFEMKNIEFWGCSYGYPDSFISFKNIKSKSLVVNGCSFWGMHNNVIAIVNSDNVTIKNNTFKNLYHIGVQSDNRSKNTKVLNNVFFCAGLGLSNTFCIICSGEDYLISGNELTNYGYGGIRVGLWYKTPQYSKPKGIVEKNSLLFDENYMKRISVEGLMDGGAIYISTINDKAVIRNNYVNGFGGAGGNRGIFCDDGALGFEIYGNVIRNIMQNDYCIASRREPSVEKRNDPQSELNRANVNNIIRDNILDGKILFRGHESFNNGCQKGANYIMLVKDEDQPQNIIDNVKLLSEDEVIFSGEFNSSCYLIRKADIKRIRESKEWGYFKRYIKKI